MLAAVPGTARAQRAVLTAQLPHTATLKRSEAKLTVNYSGAPIFKPIPGTQIEYAVNTPDEVLKIAARYYACYQGAWFASSSPTGPWALADSVPLEVKSIPPSSPVYNVTYVQAYGATPQAVTYGYTAGYMMGFVSAGVLVYGTGYYYPPVVIPGPVPVFYPYPHTYAGSVWYNPSSGAWAGRHNLWTVWRDRDRRSVLQSGDRRVGPGGRDLWPVWRRWRVVLLQSADRHVLARQRRLGRRKRYSACKLL